MRECSQIRGSSENPYPAGAYSRSWALVNLGSALSANGEAEAHERADRVVHEAMAGAEEAEAWRDSAYAQALLAACRRQEATAVAERSVRVARERGMKLTFRTRS